MKRNAIAFFHILIFLLFIATSAGAQAPETITYQGRLVDVSGIPTTTPQSVVFAIYDDPSGGSPMWTETLTITPDAMGVFTVELGTIAALTAELFDGNKRYLGLAIGGDSEMSPRQWLTSVPYAISAGNVPDSAIVTGKLADASVTTSKIADDAITSEKVLDSDLHAEDISDETGLAFILQLPANTFQSLPDSAGGLDSIAISVPGPGWVYVWAHADVSVNHISGTVDHHVFQVSDAPDVVVVNNFGTAMIALPSVMPTGNNYLYPVDAHRPFRVEAAGDVQFYFNSWSVLGGGNGDGYWNLQMTAQYFPTAYGRVMPDSVSAAVMENLTDQDQAD